MRLVAIEGGGDWFDASVDYLRLPDGMDIEAERAAHRKWYRADPTPPCLSFPDWLRSRGATDAGDGDILVVDDK